MAAVPYCDSCDRHWTPTSMRPEGTCPTCGRALELTRPLPTKAAAEPGADEAIPRTGSGKAPWHFKVLLLVLVVYLAWRAVQGVEWVAHHL
jgi:hypothetical protein